MQRPHSEPLTCRQAWLPPRSLQEVVLQPFKGAFTLLASTAHAGRKATIVLGMGDTREG